MNITQVCRALPWALCTLLATHVLPADLQAQEKNATTFPALKYADIAGAPLLSPPMLIRGETRPVMAEGMGWASPAFYDVNGDGLKDLLIGEYASRLEDRGIPVGNFVRVYKNEGTEESPKFSDFYTYLSPAEKYSTGTPLSVYSWCCLGFTPRIVDLDNDGYDDIITGQYNPGLVTWFRGSEAGFMAGERLPQFGDPFNGGQPWDHSLPRSDPHSWEYWNYSAVAFGDFDGKGLKDMIVGGAALRISKNVGSPSQPSFGRRTILLDTAGHPLKVNLVEDTLTNGAGEPYYGDIMVPTVADWDGDGLPDLLVTNTYTRPTVPAITFFRAVKSPAGLRFEPGVVLFTAKDGQKAFPGSWLHVCVADYNNDGVNDLIVGASIATLGGKFDHDLSWQWESDTDIIKINPVTYSGESLRYINRSLFYADSAQAALGLSDAEMEKQYRPTRSSLIKNYYGKGNYKTLAHQGYIYVMLGRRNEHE